MGGASRCSDSATAAGTSASPSSLASLAATGRSRTSGAAAVSANSVGSSAASRRPPEEAHAEQSRRVRSGSAVEALRETRTEELRNEEAGGRYDIVVR